MSMFSPEDTNTIQSDVKRSIFARLRGYFFAGILITAPITITVYLAMAIISFIDNNVERLIPAQYNPEQYLPISLPGIGLVFVIIMLTLIGFLTANFFGRYLIRLSEYVLDQLPIVRSIYSSIKQILEAVLAQKDKTFREVVLVEYPRRGIWVLGFVAGTTKGQVQNAVDHDMVNVFVPTTPNPTSGFLCFIPREDIYPLEMSVDEGLKMLISAAIVTPSDRRSQEKRDKPELVSQEMLKKRKVLTKTK